MKEIVHLIKEKILVEKKEDVTKYIEKYFDLNGELLFITEVEMPNIPIFANNITIKKRLDKANI